MNNILIIALTIPGVYLLSRLLTLAVLKWKILPANVLSNGKRPHHFVYGNVLIVSVALAAVGFGVNPSSWYLAVLLGVGLGLVLDEFPHWTGNVKELSRNVIFIPQSLWAIVAVECALLLILLIPQKTL